MEYSVLVRPSHLRVLSATLTDIAAGLLLGLIAIREATVLIGVFIFAIICMLFAVKIEDILEEL